MPPGSAGISWSAAELFEGTRAPARQPIQRTGAVPSPPRHGLRGRPHVRCALIRRRCAGRDEQRRERRHRLCPRRRRLPSQHRHRARERGVRPLVVAGRHEARLRPGRRDHDVLRESAARGAHSSCSTPTPVTQRPTGRRRPRSPCRPRASRAALRRRPASCCRRRTAAGAARAAAALRISGGAATLRATAVPTSEGRRPRRTPSWAPTSATGCASW